MKTKTIGDKIKKLRNKKRKNVSQDQFARDVNIPLTTLSKIETNRVKNPTINTLQKIAKELGVTIDELIS